MEINVTISFVCCNFRVGNRTFSILIKHVAIDILSSFLPFCSAAFPSLSPSALVYCWVAFTFRKGEHF